MKDRTDRYIIDHYRSMSYGEIAAKLGIDKSTVSRRAAALRASGEIEEKPSSADMAQARAVHERLKGCTIDRADRLEALAELRELLHNDLTLAGGQGLARVSSEYRAVLAEIETLSIELNLVQNAGKNVTAIDLLMLKSEVQREFEDTADREVIGQVVFSILRRLNRLDIISTTPLDMIRAETGQHEGKRGQIVKHAV